MEFLNPTALFGIFLLPLLLVPYLVRRAPRRLVFSSLLFLRELAARSLGRPWGKPHLPPIFFLQLLLLLLLILALGEPVLSIRPLRIAIVLDNSASMQALEEEKSRFELARERARDLLRGLSANARVDLYLTVPALAQIGDKGLAPGAAPALMGTLAPYDLGDRMVDYGEELSRLVQEKGYERLFFFTDHPGRGGGAIRLVTIGRPRDNLAVTSFRIARLSFASKQQEARIEVTSFSAKEEKVKLALKGGGKILASRALTVGARKSVATSFQDFPAYPAYEAEIEVDDALALDNRRFAVAPPSGALEILAISPRPQALYSLRSIPGLSLQVISPEAYERIGSEGHSLEIFHFSAPSLLPRKHALFVLPPVENPLVAVGRPISRPTISGWREPHPLTRYVNFALLRPPYARPLKPLSFGESVVESPDGAVAVGLERQGFRYLALGFDPFPYLGRENLPMSIFTLNLLEWFNEALRGPGAATGEPLDLGARAGETVISPGGEKLIVGESAALFSRTFFQGFYELARGQRKEIVAVNLQDAKESDLGDPAPIELKGEPAASGSGFSLFAFWPYFLLASILLLFLEWFWGRPAAQA